VIDKQGRLFGKVSVIDAALLAALVVLLAGLGYRRLSPKAVAIVAANTKFYVTLTVEKIRDFSLSAVAEGDVVYEQYGQQPFGTVVQTWSEQAKEVLKKQDGSVLLVPMEGKYNMYIVLEVKGSVSDNGYQVNGNTQISQGSDLRIQSNKVICGARVYGISEEPPAPLEPGAA
jgi:hypothetical protein